MKREWIDSDCLLDKSEDAEEEDDKGVCGTDNNKKTMLSALRHGGSFHPHLQYSGPILVPLSQFSGESRGIWPNSIDYTDTHIPSQGNERCMMKQTVRLSHISSWKKNWAQQARHCSLWCTQIGAKLGHVPVSRYLNWNGNPNNWPGQPHLIWICLQFYLMKTGVKKSKAHWWYGDEPSAVDDPLLTPVCCVRDTKNICCFFLHWWIITSLVQRVHTSPGISFDRSWPVTATLWLDILRCDADICLICMPVVAAAAAVALAVAVAAVTKADAGATTWTLGAASFLRLTRMSTTAFFSISERLLSSRTCNQISP